MALSARQLQMARYIMGLAAQRGLGPGRQRELAAASYAESGLDPQSVNRSSGAAGLFQLLSSGYRQKAQQLGGLHDPRANTLAILPNYLSYWRQHPRAAPGEAGRDVEISGMGSEFYARPLSLIPGGGTAPITAGMAAAPRGVGPATAVPAAAAPLDRGAIIRQAFLGQLQGKPFSLLDLMRQLREQRTAVAAQPVAARPTAGQAAARTAAGVAPSDKGRADPLKGPIIGRPYEGTHADIPNWESQRAIDVAAPIGSPVYSPFAGSIGPQFGSLGASPSSRFGGLRMHVVGPTDEAYLAHLSRFAPGIRPGRRVRPGQLLGYSGSASGVAHLHEALKYGDPYSLIR
jgi:murein DD-endopeptidase MepM/ murein hydrolase activator NlpD